MALISYLHNNPFATDEQLADAFDVSIPTIRLDRSVLGIPEVRVRTREFAAKHHDAVRALEQQEVVGLLEDLQLNRFAKSRLEVLPIHVFSRTGIARGHHLFAQINSLATAVMDADVAVTAKMELKFHRPVRLGEIVRARVDVVAQRTELVKCKAVTLVDDEMVVDGVIWVHINPAGLHVHSEEDFQL